MWKRTSSIIIVKASKKETIETLVRIWTCSSYFKIWRPEYDGTPRSSPKTSLSEVNWKDNLLSTNNKSNTIAQHVVQHLLLEHFPARHLSHEGHGHPRAWGQFKDLHDRPAGKFLSLMFFISSRHLIFVNFGTPRHYLGLLKYTKSAQMRDK